MKQSVENAAFEVLGKKKECKKRIKVQEKQESYKNIFTLQPNIIMKFTKRREGLQKKYTEKQMTHERQNLTYRVMKFLNNLENDRVRVINVNKEK